MAYVIRKFKNVLIRGDVGFVDKFYKKPIEPTPIPFDGIETIGRNSLPKPKFITIKSKV